MRGEGREREGRGKGEGREREGRGKGEGREGRREGREGRGRGRGRGRGVIRWLSDVSSTEVTSAMKWGIGLV